MVVVMPAGHTGTFTWGGGGKPFDKQMEEFGDDFSKEFRPLVEKNYRVKTDRGSRAIAGLSSVQPGQVHTLIYEDLVDRTEPEVRRLLDAIGLPFDPACLRFFENDRAVRTVSSEQVRQPIYRSGLDHWRQFAPWLAPLETALGDARDSWRNGAN